MHIFRTYPVSVATFAALALLNILLWEQRMSAKSPVMFCEELVSTLGFFALIVRGYVAMSAAPVITKNRVLFRQMLFGLAVGCVALNLYTFPKFFPPSLNPNPTTAPFLAQIIADTRAQLTNSAYRQQIAKSIGTSDPDCVFACALEDIVVTRYFQPANVPRMREVEVPPQLEDLEREYRTCGAIVGNCWDISTVLTASLRQAGYPAQTQTSIYCALNAQVGHCSVYLPQQHLNLYNAPASQWTDSLAQATYSWGISSCFSGWHGLRDTIVYSLLMVTFLLPVPRGGSSFFPFCVLHAVLVFYFLFADMPKLLRLLLLTFSFLIWPLWEVVLRAWFLSLVARLTEVYSSLKEGSLSAAE